MSGEHVYIFLVILSIYDFLALSVEKISVVLPHCLKVNFIIVQEKEGLVIGVISCIIPSHTTATLPTSQQEQCLAWQAH